MSDGRTHSIGIYSRQETFWATDNINTTKSRLKVAKSRVEDYKKKLKEAEERVQKFEKDLKHHIKVYTDMGYTYDKTKT